MPTLQAESEVSLVLPSDVQMDSIVWKFPPLTGKEWSFMCLLNDRVIFDTNPTLDPVGEVRFADEGDTLVAVKGTVLATMVRYTGESDDMPSFYASQHGDEGYSVVVKGYSLRENRPQTLHDYLFREPPENKIHNDWQEENA
jgi:hypothetical protein